MGLSCLLPALDSGHQAASREPVANSSREAIHDFHTGMDDLILGDSAVSK
jgi:hypothetical protein